MPNIECIGIRVADESKHEEMDHYGKANSKTVVYCPWHPHPEYRISNTGSFGYGFDKEHDARINAQYPAGLVIVDETGKPTPFKAV